MRHHLELASAPDEDGLLSTPYAHRGSGPVVGAGARGPGGLPGRGAWGRGPRPQALLAVLLIALAEAVVIRLARSVRFGGDLVVLGLPNNFDIRLMVDNGGHGGEEKS